MSEYLIIGDIHGEADALERLLQTVGFTLKGGLYRHPTITALFVGDLIDRGAEQLRVLTLVRQMVEAGQALITMGNHEYNAIAYATYARAMGSHYRPRNARNREQHRAFIDAVGLDTAHHKQWIEWFKQIPLFLEVGGAQIIHAYWNDALIEKLRPYLNPDNSLKAEHWIEALTPHTPLYQLLEPLLKGVEYPLPKGHFFYDGSGIRRVRTRLRWWLFNRSDQLAQLALIPSEGVKALEGITLDPKKLPPCMAQWQHPTRPTFIGHYWMSGTPALLAENVICVDYSVALPGGKLVAYHYRTGLPLHNGAFYSVPRSCDD